MDITKLKVKRLDIKDPSRFYSKYLKNRGKSVFQDKYLQASFVQTSWYDVADAVDDRQDVVLSTLDEPVFVEGIRQALELPYFSNDHEYNQEMSDGFSIDQIDLKEGNAYQQIKDKIGAVKNRQYGLNSTTTYDDLWFITDQIEQDTVTVIAYKLNNDVYDLDGVLSIFAKKREKELDKQRKAERQKQADQQFNQIMQTISQMSKKDKQKIIESLIK